MSSIRRPLVGRAEVRTAVGEALVDAKAGRGSLLVVVGDEGVGKSTILAYAVDRASEAGFRVGTTRAIPTEFPRPFAAVQEMLQAFREPPAAGSDVSAPVEAFSLLLAPLEHHEARRAAGSGGPEDPTAGEEETRRLLSALAELPRRNDQSRFLLIDRLIDDLASLAKRQPLFLGMDDFPFIDDSSLEFVAELQRYIGNHRIVLAVLGGPPANARPRLKRFLESIRSVPSTRWVEARALTPPETGELLDWFRAGIPSSPDDALRWHRRTKGNPLALEQLLRGTPFHALAPGGSEEGTRPLAEVERARAQTLSEETQRVLCYAAVIGNEFDFDTLTRALGQEPDRLSVAVEQIVHDGLIREALPGTFEFIRESFRQEMYAGLTESRRRILHRKVAEALEETSSGDRGEVFELARHFYLARDWARAVEYCRRAADIAAASYAFPEAKLHLERALECVRNLPSIDPIVEFRVDTDLGRILVEIGELRPAIEVLNAAVARARGDSRLEPELPVAILWTASAHSQLWEHEKARELAASALQLFERASNATGTAIAHRVLGAADWDTGNFERAEHHHREAARLARAADNPRVEAHAFIDLANVLIYSGPARADEALELYDRAAGLFQSSLDHPSLARVRMNRSILLFNMGRREEALREITEAEVHAEASGSLLWRVYTLLNEAVFRAEAGETTRVRLLIEKGRELNRRLRDRLSDEQITMIDGMVLENEEDVARARDRYLEALRLVEELEMIPDVLEVRYRIARLAVRTGNWEEARQQIQAARDAHIDTIRADLFPKLEALAERLPASSGSPGRMAPVAEGPPPVSGGVPEPRAPVSR
ncbi:MAG: tetratricopeptide repeat protein [Thermoplasmata archaeon]|nr:tetratricopeptide repeat protein [Thermoplasmata archaeon]